MGYYTANPYDDEEDPRCPECDDFMFQVTNVIFNPYWECRNPECEECSEKYKINKDGEDE